MKLRILANPLLVTEDSLDLVKTIKNGVEQNRISVQNLLDGPCKSLNGITFGTQALYRACQRLGLTIEDLKIVEEDFRKRLPEITKSDI